MGDERLTKKPLIKSGFFVNYNQILEERPSEFLVFFSSLNKSATIGAARQLEEKVPIMLPKVNAIAKP